MADEHSKNRFLAWKPGFLLIAVTLIAFGIRVWQLDSVPPGWRDDELINSLVISQKVIDGDWALYYSDASGHEALYHILNAGMLAIFGPGAAGIRLLSAILGTLTVPLTYLVANRLFGWKVGLLSAAGLAISFWSLMYSRLGIRHISLLVFLLPSIYFFLCGLGINYRRMTLDGGSGRMAIAHFFLAGLFMGLGFYTYFASRGFPAIFGTVLIYILLFDTQRIRKHWLGLLIMFATALFMVIPLLITLAEQPESEARIQELAVPIESALSGDYAPLGEHIARTLNMYHSDGDEEWLYNIPNRPLFAPVTAIIFWLGLAMAIIFALQPLFRKLNVVFLRKIADWLDSTPNLAIASAFLVSWWLIGLIPAFVSVPAASLGHTIIALPATYICLALPLNGIDRLIQENQWSTESGRVRRFLPLIFASVLLIALAWRDLPDYFRVWPERGMTRFLYRADVTEVASYLEQHPELSDFGISGLLAGPWDREALRISLPEDSGQTARWYNPERVVFLQANGVLAQSFIGYPFPTDLEATYYQPIDGETAGGYRLADVTDDVEIKGESVCFQNNLCLLGANYESDTSTLDLIFELRDTIELPATPLISNPPPPGIYAGSRLAVFSQIVDKMGEVISSDDGLWIDAESLQPGDRFLQQHRFAIPEQQKPEVILIGFYDPMTGNRVLTLDGSESVRFELDE